MEASPTVAENCRTAPRNRWIEGKSRDLHPFLSRGCIRHFWAVCCLFGRVHRRDGSWSGSREPRPDARGTRRLALAVVERDWHALLRLPALLAAATKCR